MRWGAWWGCFVASGSTAHDYPIVIDRRQRIRSHEAIRCTDRTGMVTVSHDAPGRRSNRECAAGWRLFRSGSDDDRPCLASVRSSPGSDRSPLDHLIELTFEYSGAHGRDLDGDRRGAAAPSRRRPARAQRAVGVAGAAGRGDRDPRPGGGEGLPRYRGPVARRPERDAVHREGAGAGRGTALTAVSDHRAAGRPAAAGTGRGVRARRGHRGTRASDPVGTGLDPAAPRRAPPDTRSRPGDTRPRTRPGRGREAREAGDRDARSRRSASS